MSAEARQRLSERKEVVGEEEEESRLTPELRFGEIGKAFWLLVFSTKGTHHDEKVSLAGKDHDSTSEEEKCLEISSARRGER